MCIFCEIVRGEHVQSSLIIYQDDLCTAFMDHIQQNPGHVLVVPNKHVRNIFDLNEALASHLFKVTTKLAKKVKTTFKPDGIDLYQCNNKSAGQSVFHFHMHIFPRKKDDKLFAIYNHQEPNWEELEKIKELKDKLIS